VRLGGPVFEQCSDPADWIAALRRHDYGAAYCPVESNAGGDLVRAYAQAATAADIVIAEVGAWSNPLSPDEATRSAALKHCQEQLALADRVGARCCVNISGSRGSQWDGPHPDNLTQETFDLIVQTIRAILDEVRPRRTFYTLETMPWMYPDSADSYLRLVKAVDRRQFAAHFDPVNLICSPQRYYANAELVRDFVVRLGPHIRCVHAKDIALSGRLTVHLDEVAPGKGGLDYSVLLSELDRLDADLPVLLEHLPDAAQYAQAAEYIRSVAARAGLTPRRLPRRRRSRRC
jgi:sugar phosphate isomerase/epimerase